MRSRKRGGPPALPPGEATVTYSRIEDAEELPPFGGDPLEDEGRREPTFTAMRVDPPRRRAGRAARVDLDDFDDRPISLDPEAMGAVAARPPRRRRSRALSLVLLVGALAVLGGVGVLGATVLKVLYGAPPVTASAPAPETQTPATDATIVPVNTPTSVLPDSGSAGPGILALPANDGGPIDVTPASPKPEPQAALEPAPVAPAAAAPAPQMKPTLAPAPQPAPAPKATAATELPPLPKPAPAAAAVNAAPSTDADINNALSDVDRLLAEKKAQAGVQPQNLSGAEPQNGAQAPTALAPLPQAPADQSAALNITPQPATEPPPLPAPNSVADPSIPVPPADIPNPSN